MQQLCSISKAYENIFGCVDWAVWKAAFDFAVDKPSNPNAEHPPWRRYYYRFAHQDPDAYLQGIRKEADLKPHQTDEQQRRLALFWKDQVKRVILQRLLFGCEINDASKDAYRGNLLPMLNLLLDRTHIFLGRRNGSVKEIGDILLNWHAALKREFPDFPEVGVDVAIGVFEMAVELRKDERSRTDRVPEVSDMLRLKWVQ